MCTTQPLRTPLCRALLTNEGLCRLAQQGDREARDRLWQRCGSYIEHTMVWENRRHHLPVRELADARQHLYLAFERAVARYDPQPAGKRRAAFTTFLHVVVVHAFANYCARWRTYRRHLASAEPDSDGGFAGDFGVVVPCSMPGFRVERAREVPECLMEVCARLRPGERNLLQLWLQTGSDRDVAARLGITADAARQRRQRLVRRLRRIISPP